MLKKIIAVLVAIPVLTFVGIYILASSQSPQKEFAPGETSRMEFEKLTEANLNSMPRVQNFKTRDGSQLPYREYTAAVSSKWKVYLLHDAGWHGMIFNPIATSLAYSGVADVIVPDLRGHGPSPAERGAVSYPDQLVDDLADLIRATAGPNDKVVIGGFSFGGGLAIRFAASDQANLADRFILFSPFLGLDSPVNKSNPDPWLHPLERKMVGLNAFKSIGLNMMGDDVVLQLAYPKAFLRGAFDYTITPDITWNTFQSLDPSDVLPEGLAAMKSPVLVIAGGQDQLFDASKYKPVLSQYTDDAQFNILDNADHINLLNSSKILSIIQNWLSQ